jgi:hypothetical protein
MARNAPLTDEQREAIQEITRAGVAIVAAKAQMASALTQRTNVLRTHAELVRTLGPTRVAREIGWIIGEGTIRSAIREV